MTNREYFEKCAGMGLEDSFFEWNDINPNDEYIECESCYNFNVGDGIDDIEKCDGCLYNKFNE